MKTIVIKLFSFLALLGMFTSCNDEWGNDNPEMEHIYYYGLGNESFPGGNELKYTVQQGSIIAIPTYFFSVFNRPYSPEVYYYTSTVPNSDPQLVCGEDYVVVDSNGNTLTPGSDGAYKMIWPNAVGGSQNVYIKALNGQKGFLRVLTFDPNKTIVATDVSSTTIIKTEEYEVRAFTENYYVTVEIK